MARFIGFFQVEWSVINHEPRLPFYLQKSLLYVNISRRLFRKKPAIAPVMLIGGIMMMAMALIGVVITFSGAVESTWMDLALETPGFDYDIIDGEETGNEMLNIYQMMRIIAAGIFGLLLVFAGVSKVMESSEMGIVQQGTANRMISKSLLFLLIIMVFPPMWDESTKAITNVSYWILNPIYTFDENNPCPEGWTNQKIISEYGNSHYVTNIEKRLNGFVDAPGGGLVFKGNPQTDINNEHKSVCGPQFKVTYVFDQMLRVTEAGPPTEQDNEACRNELIERGIINSTDIGKITIHKATGLVEEIKNELTSNCDGETNADWLGNISNSIQVANEDLFVNLFLGLTKALVAIQVLIISLMIGIMTDMLAAMVSAALPIFLMLSLLPKVDKVTNQMLEALPALLLLPIMSAIIIVVGASVVLTSGGEGGMTGTITTWITSIGVVFFAITLPVLMIPMLGSMTSQATMVVSSAVQTAGMVTGMAATSAVTAVGDSMKAGGGWMSGLKAGMGGLAMGSLGGMSKISGDAGMSGMTGGMNIGMNQMASGMGEGVGLGHGVNPEAAAMPSLKEQKKITEAVGEQAISGTHHHEQAEGLSIAFPHSSGFGWDGSLTPGGNAANIDKEIESILNNDDMSVLSAEQQEAIENWDGPARQEVASMQAGEADTNTLKHTFTQLAEQAGQDPNALPPERVNETMKNVLHTVSRDPIHIAPSGTETSFSPEQVDKYYEEHRVEVIDHDKESSIKETELP